MDLSVGSGRAQNCIPRGNSRRNKLRHFGPLGYLNPREEEEPMGWSFRFRYGFVLSYRWFALGVGFGRPDWRPFRVNNVGSRSA